MLDSVDFRCISCLEIMPHVVRLKPVGLIPCKKCSKVKGTETPADEYFEFSTVLIIIDLLLLKKEAFAHLVFNMKLKHRPIQVTRSHFWPKFYSNTCDMSDMS